MPRDYIALKLFVVIDFRTSIHFDGLFARLKKELGKVKPVIAAFELRLKEKNIITRIYWYSF